MRRWWNRPEDDPLRPATGCLVGLAVGAIVWIAVGFLACSILDDGSAPPPASTPSTTEALPDRMALALHFDDGTVQHWTCEPYRNAYDEPALRDCQEGTP